MKFGHRGALALATCLVAGSLGLAVPHAEAQPYPPPPPPHHWGPPPPHHHHWHHRRQVWDAHHQHWHWSYW